MISSAGEGPAEGKKDFMRGIEWAGPQRTRQSEQRELPEKVGLVEGIWQVKHGSQALRSSEAAKMSLER